MTRPKVQIEVIRRSYAERLEEVQRLKESGLLDDVARAAKHAEASQRELDRAIATALYAREPKNRIAKAANLSPQALSNRIRRDRRRKLKDQRYRRAAYETG